MKLLKILALFGFVYLISFVNATCNKPTIVNGAVSPDNSTIAVNETYTPSCDTGYEISNNTDLECQDDGTFVPTAPTCSAVTCSKPTIVNGAVSPDNATIGWNDTYTPSCDAGFTISADTDLECQDDGTLSPTAPTCTTITCSMPTIVNGAVSPDSATIGVNDTYTPSCDAGYELSSDTALECQSDGTLSPTAPTCSAITCSKPTIVNGAVSPDSATIGVDDTYTPSCDAGYELSNDTDLECQDDGTLSPAAPTCSAVTCSKPTIVNGDVSPDNATIGWNDTYTASCDAGYELSDDTDLECQDDGTLSPAAPTCSAVTCSKPTIVNGGVSPDVATIEMDETYTPSCDDDYTLSSEADLVCQSDGTLSPSAPTCTSDDDEEEEEEEDEEEEEEEEDPCTPNPCKNDGTCKVKKGSFKCTCASGYSGTKCQTKSSAKGSTIGFVALTLVIVMFI